MADTNQVADTERWIRVATDLAKALLAEIILWSSVTPVQFSQYEHLRQAIYQKTLEEAPVDEKTRTFIAEHPPWKGSEAEMTKARKKIEEFYSDPEVLRVLKRGIEKIVEDGEGNP